MLQYKWFAALQLIGLGTLLRNRLNFRLSELRRPEPMVTSEYLRACHFSMITSRKQSEIDILFTREKDALSSARPRKEVPGG